MSFFTPLENRAPYLKLVAFGSAGTGKTWFLASVAIGLWRKLNAKAPVGFLDTEDAAVNTLPLFKAAGVPVVHRATRRPEDLVEAMRLTRAGELALLVGDSWTHFWESFALHWAADHGVKSRPLSPTERGDMKSDWRRLVSDPFRADPCHYLIAGRASAEYGSETDDDTGRRESFQSGLRMRSEGDTTYEGGLVVRLERRERAPGEGAYRVGVVEKDRTGAIDGHVLNLDGKLAGPCWQEVAPAVERLLANAAPAAPLSTIAPLALAGPSDFQRSRDDATRKGLLLDEQEVWLANAFPGSGKDAVAARTAILVSVYRSPAPGYAKTLRLQELEVRHQELHDALVKAGRDAPSAFLDLPPATAKPGPVQGQTLAAALGEDLPDFAAGVEEKPNPPAPSPSSTPAASLSVHQISEKHARSPVTVTSVTEPANALQAPKPVAGSVPVAGVSSEPTSSVNAGESGSVAGAAGAVMLAAPARECVTASKTPGVPEATPPHGNPRARVPFTREVALESLGPKCSPSLISDLVECPEDQILGSGSQVLFQAEKEHGKDVAENAWLSAGGKWSQATEKRAPKRLSMRAGQWRNFVMSLPVKFSGAPKEKDDSKVMEEIASCIPAHESGRTL